MSVVLDVTVRDKTGTGKSREARNNGMVPGILYGGDEAPIAIAVKHNEVLKAINSGQFISNMIELSHEGKKQKVITKDIQFHPVTDMPLHLDFYRVTAKSEIEVEVSVNFIGEEESPGLKQGGALNVVRYVIEVKCPAGSIPENIEVDISALEIKLPKGVVPSISDRDFTIATIMNSRASTTEEEVEEATESETGETVETDKES
jgi:large subunit ribosomal protein L25